MDQETRLAWRERLLASKRKTVEAILTHGKDILEFKEDCDIVSGGSTFSKDIAEWLGYSQQTASCWLIIGRNVGKLTSTASKLPPSWYTIYALCALPAEDIAKLANPELTRREVEAYIKRKEEEERLSAKPDYNDATAGFQEKFWGRSSNEFDTKGEWESWCKQEARKREEEAARKRASQPPPPPPPPQGIIATLPIQEVVARLAPEGPHNYDEALAVLGLARGCRPEIIKLVTRWYRQQYHPDKGGDKEIAVALNKAADILDPVFQLT